MALGLALRGIASAAVDVSDGLLGDLGHILAQSGVGATIATDSAMQLIATKHLGTRGIGQFDTEKRLEYVLAGGDDYELAFTAPADRRRAVEAAAVQAGTPVTRIGRIEAAPGLRLVDGEGRPLEQRFGSFDHFA